MSDFTDNTNNPFTKKDSRPVMAPGWQKVNEQIFGAPPTKPIVKDGLISVGAYKLTSLGLTIDRMSFVTEEEEQKYYDDWLAVGEILFHLEGSIQLLIGDWLVHAEHVWGVTYEQVAEQTGRDQKTLRNYKYVADSVELSLRRDNLTYTHYMTVAGLPDDMKASFLERSGNEGWSVARLRYEIKQVTQPALPPENTRNMLDFGQKHKDMKRLEKASYRAGQGDERAKIEAIGWIAKQRQWLDELEEWLSD